MLPGPSESTGNHVRNMLDPMAGPPPILKSAKACLVQRLRKVLSNAAAAIPTKATLVQGRAFAKFLAFLVSGASPEKLVRIASDKPVLLPEEEVTGSVTSISKMCTTKLLSL